MCATCTLTDRIDRHVDGTVLDHNLVPLFSGSAEEIMQYIMLHPTLVHSVWVAGEGEAISIDVWTDEYEVGSDS